MTPRKSIVSALRIAVLLMLVLTTMAVAQNEAKSNQYTPKGSRSGKWFTYYSNGNVESVGYYKTYQELTEQEKRIAALANTDTTAEGIRVGEWKVYTSDGRVAVVTNYSTGMHDVYEYDRGGHVKYVSRSWKGKGTVYVLGRRDSVVFKNIGFQRDAPALDALEIRTKAYNLSDHTVAINLIPIPLRGVEAKTYKIPAGDSVDVVARFFQPAGNHINHLVLQSNEWVFGLELNTFGYHVTSEDFVKKTSLNLPPRSYYYRTNEEYLLKITTARGNPVKQIPLAAGKVEISLKRGNYLFTIVSDSYQRHLPVEVD